MAFSQIIDNQQYMVYMSHLNEFVDMRQFMIWLNKPTLLENYCDSRYIGRYK